jgi:CheY-specific phosphatase CheX
MPAPSRETPQEVTDAFTSAAVTALQEMVQLEAFAEPLAAPAPMEGDELVVATLPLAGESPGSMNLIMTAQTAADLAGRYLPQGTMLTQEIVDDTAGEFANVIGGQAKTFLKGTPRHFTISPPSVRRVQGHGAPPAGAMFTLVILLTFEGGCIQVTVS